MQRYATVVVLLLASAPSTIDAANCKVPGFDFAAFGDVSVSVGNGNTDSYDSNAGPYVACVGSACVGGVGTNSTSSGGISLGPNGDINGQCQIGAGAPTSYITPNSGNCNSLTVQSSALAMPVPTLPASLAGTYGAITNNLTIPAAGSYSMTSLSLSGNKALTVGAGPVIVYLTGSGSVMSLSGNAAVNNNTQKASNLIFMCTSSAAQTIDVVGNGNAYYAIYCPKADITIAGNGTIYGAIVGRSVTFNGNNGYVHYDTQLANYTSGQITCGSTEISRAAPIVANVSNTSSVVQGTFELPSGTGAAINATGDVAGWTFPHIVGHMRARAASTITTNASTFSSGTILFDAGATGKIPTANNAGCTALDGSCRNVFTVTSSPGATGVQFHPTKVQLNDTNASAVGALIAPTATVSGIGSSHWQTIVRTVIAGKLGGVDRSTVAVIEPSTLVTGANASRPTMAYFGGTDGMLHAVCASTGGTTASQQTSVCPSLGAELWAFIPRTQLPLMRTNTQRLDGSVRVIDAFGDFTNNPPTGTKSWRTILVFQTGYGAAAYALDVSDPASPVILWEATPPSSPAAFDLGTGLTVAAGSVRINNKATNVAVLQTNNGGTGGTGVVARAVSLETGATIWTFGYAYPSPPRNVSADLPLPTTGIPGGAVGVDMTGNGYVTDFVFGDLYGNLWRVDASDGTSRNGTNTPLFSFSSNRKPIGTPPAIYNNGSNYAAFASGGYADPTSAAWVSGTQYLLAVKLSSTGSTIDETGTASTSGTLGVKVALTANHKGFSQALVVGTSLVLATDSTDVNSSTYGTSTSDTGEVTRVDLLGSVSTTVVGMSSGGTALANSGTTLYSSSSSKQQQLSTVGTTGGTRVDINVATAKLIRALWIRTE